ncbi:TetR/AcrR family transcriptional regulator [Metaclostridioides mangenotii]|uniref:TetR/AcrR family transcriptional regulator n=1 Tax=Metaclostridioides mangenotii TaxID=1540 RepID=UPI000463B51A|nr:TetR/AcrR family transcriptional regulator [Clostridioides mangenotii]
MKQKEKSKISKEKILNSALVEFGTKSYESASLNNICNENGISKGLIYHYFKDKEALYLTCVKSCFDKLTEYLKDEEDSNIIPSKSTNSIKNYLDRREHFFYINPLYGNIFFQSIIQPPRHLKEQIKELRKEFDVINIKHYKRILDDITLRDEFTESEALKFFVIFQEMYNGYFQNKAFGNSDFNTLVEIHELKLSKLLDILLYGIAKEEK